MINVHKYLFEYILAVMFPVKCHAADKIMVGLFNMVAIDDA